MAGDKKIVQSEVIAAEIKSDHSTELAEQNAGSRKKGMPSNSLLPYPVVGIPTVKGGTDEKFVPKEGVYFPPTNCYDYHYPGYNGAFNQLDDHGYLNGIESDSGSPFYYLPGYNPFDSGSFLGVDGQQPYFSSSGFPQQPVSYGSEAMPFYSWDSTYVGDVASWSTKDDNVFVNSNGMNSKKTSVSNGKSYVSGDMTSRYSMASPNVSKSVFQTQGLKPINKSGSSIQPAGYMMGYKPAGNFPLLNSGESEASSEVTRGPRGHTNFKPASLSNEEEKLLLTPPKDRYNLEDFKTEYDSAKFFIIKSYSENDVHKCIKYNVWSSTPNGNKKLDAAFQEAEAVTNERGTNCPIFLFFSVNGSGQFVGVAEMIGRVDFDKNMDFWQLDKWNGFFPVKWHIIKDVPNVQLRHIALENNDSRSVTYTRDTQEIRIVQGLQMLKIFKDYSAKTSVLDDFSFYERGEKLLRAKRSSKLAFRLGTLAKNYFPESVVPGEMTTEIGIATPSSSSDPTSHLVDLTRNISLDSHSSKSTADKSALLLSSSEHI